MQPLQFDFFGIFANVTAFLLFFILIGGIVGMISRKLSVAGFGSILVFSHVVLETDIFIFDAVLYLVLFVVALWASAFLVRGYMGQESEI